MLRRLWNGREGFVRSMTGELLPVLRAFQTSHNESSKRIPRRRGGCPAHRAEGYLTLAGMVQFAGERHKPRALRDGIDALAARGVVRRGLVLGCGPCGRPAFIAIGSLAQVNECPRCGAANELAQRQWRQPAEEPSWYYDLHPVARELLADHGEVPLLLSRHLRSAARRYDDVRNWNCETHQTNPWPRPTSLQSAAMTSLSPRPRATMRSRGTAREIRRAGAKRVMLADVLHANQIILATTEPQWNDASITEIRSAVTGHPWPAGLRPAIRLITDLGSDEVKDLRLDLASGTAGNWS